MELAVLRCSPSPWRSQTRQSPRSSVLQRLPNFAENGTSTVYTAAASDSDGDILTYSLVGGSDRGLVDIDSSSDVLTFKSAPDYEIPEDSETNIVIENRDA